MNFDSNTLVIDATNNRVGVGTASPALALDVVGTAQVGNSSTNASTTRLYNNNSQLIIGVDSSAGGNTGTAYAQYFLGIGAYPMTFWTNTSERMRIDSSGNVGIGTSSPTALLHVNGTARATSMSLNGVTIGDYNLYSGMVTRVSNGGGIGINSANSTDNAYIYFGYGTTSLQQQGAAIGRIGGDVLGMFTSASERMRIDASGNVGIGTSSPNNKLEALVNGGATVGIATNISAVGTLFGKLAFYSTAASNAYIEYGGQIRSYSGGGIDQSDLRFYTANGSVSTERMRIDSSGNVGIGTSSPAARLDINTGGSSNTMARFTSNGSYFSYILTSGVTSVFSADTSGNNSFTVRGASNQLECYTNGTERMRIDANGNVSVNTSTSEGSSKVTTVSNENGICARTTASAGSYEAIVASRTGNTGKVITFWHNLTTGQQAGFINIDSTTSVSLNNTSDYRAKENVQPLTNCIERVKNLKPVSFNFKVDGYATEGFIAHEFAEVIPQAVHGEKDAIDKNGNPVYQAIDQSKIIPLLTAAIQEQQAIINDLKTRIETLESK